MSEWDESYEIEDWCGDDWCCGDEEVPSCIGNYACGVEECEFCPWAEMCERLSEQSFAE